MVDPHNITNYRRTESELEEFMLFTMAVAGKTAVVISKAIDRFITDLTERYGDESWQFYGDSTPFTLLRIAKKRKGLRAAIVRAKLGKTRVLTKGYGQIADTDLDLKTVKADDLELICGVGPKTSRFFILHSRENEKVAVLDTHMLHYLRDKGYDAPKSTPSGKKYGVLERIVLSEAEKSGLSVADFDLSIWKRYTKTKPLVN